MLALSRNFSLLTRHFKDHFETGDKQSRRPSNMRATRTARIGSASVSSVSLLLALTVPTTLVNASEFDELDNTTAGIEFQHQQADSWSERLEFLQTQVEPFGLLDIPKPFHGTGKPGLALIDFDNDGDDDIFVTNVENAPNGLFKNQLVETNQLTFVDVAANAGIADPEHNAAGTCYADIDNDGDQDLFVAGDQQPHRLYENQGNGQFVEIAGDSGDTFSNLSNGVAGSSCSFGDINNDGYVDLTVGHSWNYDDSSICLIEPFVTESTNELFLNNGDNSFTDISATAGILELGGFEVSDIFPELPDGLQGLTWSVRMVDYDQDGDVDLFNMDDQCGFIPEQFGGFSRGFIQLWENDGDGDFENVTEQAGLNVPCQWMGLEFADFNGDGHLDLYGACMGDYTFPVIGIPTEFGASASRHFTANGDGTFSDPGVGPLVGSSVFGWGATAEDFDNDGDTDVLYSGGIDLAGVVMADNPDALLLNDGSANFTYIPGSTNNRGTNSNSQGQAAGDLNGDGFMDTVMSSNLTIPQGFPLVPSPAVFGTDFDATALFFPQLLPAAVPGEFVFSGLVYEPGELRVELNQGTSGYRSVSVTTLGSIGLTAGGSVNRNGIGATVRFTPVGGQLAMKPVTGGNSHISQSSRKMIFGLGRAKRGTLEILWPGGVRNRLHGVRTGQHVTFPEIPCSFDTDAPISSYVRCVHQALNELHSEGIINRREKAGFLSSALRAYRDNRSTIGGLRR